MLYFYWDTNDFQKALLVLFFSPLMVISSPWFFIMLLIHSISIQSHPSNAFLSIYQVSLNKKWHLFLQSLLLFYLPVQDFTSHHLFLQ